MKKQTAALLGVFFLLALAPSCKKDTSLITKTTIKFNIGYVVDNQPLLLDSMMYQNQAGNLCSVNRLEYYISGITLTNDTGLSIEFDSIFYVNARAASANSFSLTDVPAGHYKTLQFHIGLRPDQNISFSLPPTSENVNMAWPDPMGGGYHFIKLEGYVLSGSSELGYAVHLGNNMHLVTCTIDHHIELNEAIEQLNLTMNINEWYKNPNTYDLINDGNYTMGTPSLMNKIAQNGTDVFSVNQ